MGLRRMNDLRVNDIMAQSLEAEPGQRIRALIRLTAEACREMVQSTEKQSRALRLIEETFIEADRKPTAAAEAAAALVQQAMGR